MYSFTCLLKKEGDQFASLCVELDVASCGDTEQEAINGLRNAIEAYIEFMIDERRQDEIERPVPMNELKDFLFPISEKGEYPFKAFTIEVDYAKESVQ